MEFLDQNGKPVDWDSVKGVIFDVDGTLYHQKPVRLRMALRLGYHVLRNPLDFRKLLGIYHFRKLREAERFRVQPLEKQIQEAARLAGIQDAKRLKEAIQKWMFDMPLPLIRAHRNRETLRLLNRLHTEGKKILIYSDYAPEQKLNTLEVKADAVYYPGTNGIEELKPSGKSVQRILEDQGFSPEEMVFVGDRPERDGESARAAGMRFILV